MCIRDSEYIMMKPDAEIACLFRPVLESNGIDASNYSDEFLKKVVSLVKGRVNFVKELWDQTRFFCVAPTEDAAKDVDVYKRQNRYIRAVFLYTVSVSINIPCIVREQLFACISS